MTEFATFYDRFFVNVSVGLLITIFGALLLLVAGICLSRRPEPFVGERHPPAIRALGVLGFTIFFIGIVWQIVGYARYVR
jgi:hypothetical protein